VLGVYILKNIQNILEVMPHIIGRGNTILIVIQRWYNMSLTPDEILIIGIGTIMILGAWLPLIICKER